MAYLLLNSIIKVFFKRYTADELGYFDLRNPFTIINTV